MDLRLSTFLALLAISSFVPRPGFAKGPYEPFSIGNWQGGAYTSDETGAFSHCAAGVSYQSGINLLISLESQGWKLGFHNNTWRLVVGESIPVTVSFDGGAPTRLTAVPIDGVTAIVPMPLQATLLRAFMDANVMEVNAAGNRFHFFLEGSLRVVPLLANCLKRHAPQAPAGVAEGQPQRRAAPRLGPAPVAKGGPSETGPSDAEAERSKLIDEAAAEHFKCLHSQMRQIVPYSTESAETLAQVVITKCEVAEKKFVSLGMALFNASRSDVEQIVGQALEKQKKKMVAEIVSFRAELNKAIMSQPNGGENSTSPEGKKAGTGI
jgi:hypothetical protein